MLNWLPEAASTYAADLDGLLIFITAIVGVWFILAEALLIGFAIVFRRKPGQKAAYLPGRSLRAMSWVLVPCLVILGFDLVIDGVAAPIWDKVKIELPEHPDEVVGITGLQWAWKFTLPGPDGELGTGDDIEVMNELHVPVGKTVQFDLRATDVLHSFFVPELRLKQDAVPGRAIKGWFNANKIGAYEVVCAEICGVAHTIMKGRLVVESEEAYRAWVQSKTQQAAASSTTEETDQG